MKRKASGSVLKWMVFGLCIVVFSVFLRASFMQMGTNRCMVTAWTIEDGLPQNSILCLIQTSEGYIWFGTQSGLVRFDGIMPQVYNRWNTKRLKSDRILSLYQDDNGVLWVGTDGGGVSRYKDGQWACYTTSEGLSNNTVRAITGDAQGNLWLGTDNGVNLLEHRRGSIKTYTVEDGLSGYSVTALTVSSDGTLWIGTGGSGLNRLKDGKLLPFPHNQTFFGRIINVLHEDSQGILRVGTDTGLVTVFHDEIRIDDRLQILADQPVNTIIKDDNGTIWFGTDGEGLYRFQPHEGTLTSITTQQGLPENFIYSLMEDSEGNLWIGTYTTGLVRLKQVKAHSVTVADGLPENKVLAVLGDDNGILWAGMQRKGLAKIKFEDTAASVLQTLTTAEGLPGDRVRALCLDREQNLWIGIEGIGLAGYTRGKFRVYTIADGLAAGDVTALFQDRHGTLWVGTGQGLSRSTPNETGLPFQKTGLTNIHIRTVIEDGNGNLLVGTKNGLYRSQNQPNRDDLRGVELSSEYDILALYEDKSRNLWIGTNGSGLLRLEQGDPAHSTVFTIEHGLPGNYIFSIHEDAGGNFWMSSYRGVIRVSRRELDEAAKKNGAEPLLTVVTYDEKEGMPGSECVMSGQPSAWKTSNREGKDILFVPTVKGIALFSLESTAAPTPPPPVIIEHVIADNRSIADLESTAVFPTETGVVEFYFTALNFTAPDKVRILYKLDGFDTRWQEASPQQKRMALYLNLPPGDYGFNVIACSNDGVWNRKGARFTFRIEAPFYKRPVFYFLVLLGLAILGGGVYYLLKYRQHAMARKEEEEKKKDKYKTSALLPETVEQVLPRLTRLMEEEKVFLSPDLTLKKLSQQLNVHYNHISQIINEHLGQSFNDYINHYRIEEAKKILTGPAGNQKNILEIAYDTGFYSKSVFNTAFKKFTGMTPSEFKKKGR